MLSTLALVLGGLVVGPIYLAFMFVFLALWLVSFVTCVGPIAHCCGSRADKRKLGALVRPSPGGCVDMVPAPSGCKLAVRWNPGSNPALPPVCIPNGLGATLITISALHERLVSMGYPVLSYDRAGVGMSEPRPWKKGQPAHAGPEEVVADLAAVMESVGVPADTKWILIGPSMGSIVAQCFLAVHPHRVSGFLNMDGFPFPFAAKRRRFELAAYVYYFYEAVVPTGILRPFLYLASAAGAFTSLASASFPVPIIRAQMNQAQFFGSLAREMITMMDCADFARKAWGPAFDLQTMDKAALGKLVNARPAAYGEPTQLTPQQEGKEGKGWTWEDKPRGKWEHGQAWEEDEAVRAVVSSMLAQHKAGKTSGSAGAAAVLPDIFTSGLVVRVMNARNYNFPGGTRYFDAEMKDYAASEGNLQVLLAGGGARRTAFPSRHHGQMFFGNANFIAGQVEEIAQELAAGGPQKV